MRKVLENVLVQNLAKEIGKLMIPKDVHVRVIIETVKETPKKPREKQDKIEICFFEEIEGLPVADDLPEDLAHQHDHYLYGLPKKS